jgi:hypothetical protein
LNGVIKAVNDPRKCVFSVMARSSACGAAPLWALISLQAARRKPFGSAVLALFRQN